MATSSIDRVTLPVSTFARSSTSLINAKRCRPAMAVAKRGEVHDIAKQNGDVDVLPGLHLTGRLELARRRGRQDYAEQFVGALFFDSDLFYVGCLLIAQALLFEAGAKTGA